MLDQTLLDRAELQYLTAGDEPIGVQGFLRSDNHGRCKRKGIDLCLLLLKSAAVHLNELGIDAGNAVIIVTAVVDHIENAPVQRVVLFQRIFHRSKLSAFHRQFLPFINIVLAVCEHTQAYGILCVEQTEKNLLC